jgi:hypothetical protein
MATNDDATYNGKTIKGSSTLTSGESTATLRITFFTEVDNPDGLTVGYPDPKVVASAINMYAAQQGWPDVTFVVEEPSPVDTLTEEDLNRALGL